MTVNINFDLSGLREAILIKIAQANGLTPEEYAKNIVTGFLEGQARGFYQDKFNNLTTLEMINMFGNIS